MTTTAHDASIASRVGVASSTSAYDDPNCGQGNKHASDLLSLCTSETFSFSNRCSQFGASNDSDKCDFFCTDHNSVPVPGPGTCHLSFPLGVLDGPQAATLSAGASSGPSGVLLASPNSSSSTVTINPQCQCGSSSPHCCCFCASEFSSMPRGCCLPKQVLLLEQCVEPPKCKVMD